MEIIKKQKEIVLYLVFGVGTTLISIISFAVLHLPLGMNELLANIFSWIISVMFAFLTNRIWVFDGKTDSARAFFIQMATFFGGRLLTLAIEEAIVYIFITRMGYNSLLIKVIASIIVIVLNYVISKLIVFRKK